MLAAVSILYFECKVCIKYSRSIFMNKAIGVILVSIFILISFQNCAEYNVSQSQNTCSPADGSTLCVSSLEDSRLFFVNGLARSLGEVDVNEDGSFIINNPETQRSSVVIRSLDANGNVFFESHPDFFPWVCSSHDFDKARSPAQANGGPHNNCAGVIRWYTSDGQSGGVVDENGVLINHLAVFEPGECNNFSQLPTEIQGERLWVVLSDIDGNSLNSVDLVCLDKDFQFFRNININSDFSAPWVPGTILVEIAESEYNRLVNDTGGSRDLSLIYDANIQFSQPVVLNDEIIEALNLLYQDQGLWPNLP